MRYSHIITDNSDNVFFQADVNQVYRYNRRILPNDNFTGDRDDNSSPDQSPRTSDSSNGSSSNFNQYRAISSRPMDPRMLHSKFNPCG